MHRPSLALAILALVVVGPVLGAQERTKPAAKPPKPPAKAPATPPKPPAPTFDFASVVKKAEKLAARDYKEPPSVPDWLVNISYDQARHPVQAGPGIVEGQEAAVSGPVLPPRALLQAPGQGERRQ
jgi:hypothetical protein